MAGIRATICQQVGLIRSHRIDILEIGKEDRKEPGMPVGPQGQKRPKDPIANSVMVAKIATGEIKETKVPKEAHASQTT